MLRPIDVIFKHPVKKFTVIYQNGQLWQLPRLEFDGNSLRHKRPYTGSREQIFVAQDQTLPSDDVLLRSQLATLTLPDTVAGKNADEFERWWQQNSFGWQEASKLAKQQQAHAKALLANPNAQPTPTLQTATAPVENTVPPQPTPLPTISTQPSTAITPATLPDNLAGSPNTISQPPPPNHINQPQPQTVSPSPAPASPDLTDFDDVFGDMMADLTKDL